MVLHRLIFSSVFFLLISNFSFGQHTPSSWESRGPGSGGALYAPSINPHNPSEIYISCDMSEVYHSKDGGANFRTVSFDTLSGKYNSFVHFTEDINIRYTLKKSSNGSGYSLLKSVDKGANWQSISSQASQYGLFRLFVDPSNHNRLLVSDFTKIWYSKNGGSDLVSTPTIFTSSNSSSGNHLAGVFFDGDTIYACTNEGLFRTYNDGGAWNTSPIVIPGIVSANEKIVSFVGAREGGIVRFFCTTITPTNPATFVPPLTSGDNVTQFTKAYKIDYLTQSSWQQITALSPPTRKAYNIVLHPNNINTIYMVGQKMVSGYGKLAVFKSIDGGTIWSDLFLPLTANVNSNTNITTGWMASSSTIGYKWGWINGMATDVALDPTDLNHIIITDKYTAHSSIDGGATWKQIYCSVNPTNSGNHAAGSLINLADTYATNGLESTATYWLQWTSKNNLIGCFADLTMSLSNDGGNYWSFNYSGIDSAFINDCSMMVKHNNGKLYAATGDIPGSNGDFTDSRLGQSPGRIAVSSNNGTTWQVFKSFGRPVLWIELDPLDAEKMYVAVADTLNGTRGNIWMCTSISTNSGWSKLTSVPAGTQNRPIYIKALGKDTLVCAYMGRNSGSNTYTATSGVFYSTDNGNTWNNRMEAVTMQYDVKSLTIDPNDPKQDTWFACVGSNGSGSSGVYKTVNRGVKWTKINSTILPVNCAFHPTYSNEMYLTTSNDGLYYVTHTDQVSPTFTKQTTYPFKYPWRVFFNPYDLNEVWVSSFGNGYRVGTTPSNITSISNTLFNSKLQVYVSNPSQGIINLQFNSFIHNAKLELYDQMGKKLIAINKFSGQSYTLNAQNVSNGIYFLQIIVNGSIMTKKIIIQK